MISFSWDPEKNIRNTQKHGVSFEEAATTFLDENAMLYPDPYHSDDEERFLLVGFSSKANFLIIVHCYRKEEEIRIISARKATKNERVYFNEMRG